MVAIFEENEGLYEPAAGCVCKKEKNQIQILIIV